MRTSCGHVGSAEFVVAIITLPFCVDCSGIVAASKCFLFDLKLLLLSSSLNPGSLFDGLCDSFGVGNEIKWWESTYLVSGPFCLIS